MARCSRYRGKAGEKCKTVSDEKTFEFSFAISLCYGAMGDEFFLRFVMALEKNVKMERISLVVENEQVSQHDQLAMMTGIGSLLLL